MLSVITLTYNNLSELKRTLSTLPPESHLQSIVINGGSDLETVEFLKTYDGVVINERDQGISDAFNKGIANSSGNYIMFLNSGDELLDKEYPIDAAEILNKKNEYSFVHSNLLFIDRSGAELFIRPPLKNLGRGMPYLHPTMIVRRKLFDEIGGFNEKIKIAMDYDWIVRLEKKEYKGYYIDQNPPVRMEGAGKSVLKEREALRECYKILHENNCLNLKNFTGYSVRYILYLVRNLMTAVKLDGLLLSLKKIKHSR